MFEQLSERLQLTVKRVRGQARITEQNVTDTLREVRTTPVIDALFFHARYPAELAEVLVEAARRAYDVKVAHRHGSFDLLFVCTVCVQGTSNVVNSCPDGSPSIA